MLTPGWYLPTIDWFAQLPPAPRPADDVQAAVHQLDQLLRHDPAFGPAQTVAATHTLLLSVEHLGEAMAYAPQSHDVTEAARLLCGLNLTTAHLTQTIQRIADQAHRRAFAGLDRLPGAKVQVLTDHLSTAGVSGELLAGHLKEAHLILRSLTS